mmetsp:Transcript_13122/g.22165  ORF Transcript_13122/g.22165 Transcript_13122/m.22165 type:complete len:114 (-) Transcript_13122:236-577(-)
MSKSLTSRSRFVSAGKSVINNHVNSQISNPGEVVNVKGGIKQVEEFIDGCQQNLREYKKEIDMLRQEISMMDNHLSTLNDENIKLINPQIIQNFDDLQAQIVLQRKDNDHMQR